MSKVQSCGLLILSTLFAASVAEMEFPHCNCDGDSFWSVEGFLRSQKASDLLIAAAYFSIPLELLYFATCSNLFPFKWLFFQFGAFIVLCGLTHLLNVFTYEHHSFLLMLGLTISKFLTALVSFLTAITLLTLIPRLLRVMVRESYLRIKARELDREVVLMKRQEEASWHVRMLTQEIRKSLDRHTILYTTLVELSKTMELQNCAVWMPNEAKTEVNLTYELRRRGSSGVRRHTIPINDPDVMEIMRTEGSKILRPDSFLGSASSGVEEAGAAAAIRMPMLKVSDFKGGTPEVIQACYAILVLVLPRDGSRIWSPQGLGIIEVVADQVAVALSHAVVLEESQLMRDRLVEQNRALLQAKQNVMMASEARNSFQRVISQGMRRPVHSILGLLSMMQLENLTPEQMLIIDTMAKTGGVLSTLINDVMKISTVNREHFSLEMRSFRLQSMLKEAACVARCLCDCKGFSFGVQIENVVPDQVLGDERRIFHVILHMVANLLIRGEEGHVSFRVRSDREMEDWQGQKWVPWKSNISDVYTCVKFEIGIERAESFDSSLSVRLARRPISEGFDMGLSFGMCKKLVQLMQGNIWAVPSSEGFPKSMTLVLRFQLQPSMLISEQEEFFEHHRLPSASLFKGLRVLLTDVDGINRAVTQKMLEKLGCCVLSVSSGTKCLSSLSTSRTPYQLVILDINMPEISGFEVATRIREFGSACWPSVVALTASMEEDMWDKCVRSGINGLIQKPVVFQAMKEELFRVLQHT